MLFSDGDKGMACCWMAVRVLLTFVLVDILGSVGGKDDRSIASSALCAITK